MPETPGLIRVLVVAEEEALARWVASAYEGESGFQVVGRSRASRPGLELRNRHCDLVVFAGEQGALEYLRELRKSGSLTPVLLLRPPGSGERLSWGLEAISLGGFVFLEWPAEQGRAAAFLRELRLRSQVLVDAVRRRAERDKLQHRTPAALPALPRPRQAIEAVGIGISTGGPSRLLQLFRDLSPGLGIPIFVVQHMPKEFTPGFADSLARAGRWPVEEARHDIPVAPNRAYLAPGDWHMRVDGTPRHARILLDQGAPENACRPAADVLFRSLAEVYGGGTLALVLTGMGHDGLAGCRELARRGAVILAQDESSSTVWGMPRAVVDAGLADAVLDGSHFQTAIEQLVTRSRP